MVPAPHARRRGLAAIGLVVLFSGCEPRGRDTLIVATDWPAADRERITREFAGWLLNSGHAPLLIDWLILARGDDIERLVYRRRPPDVLLGGPPQTYARLAAAGKLAPLPIDGSPVWAVAREFMIPPSSLSRSKIILDDPRIDPRSLTWAEAGLDGDHFGEGYARLVRLAATSRRIGRGSPPAFSTIDGGQVPSGGSDPGSIPWIEGVAVISGGRQEEAHLFLDYLAAAGHAGPIPAERREAVEDDLGLLADLLGATLVDAQDELWSAWAALDRSGSPPGQLRWMTEPPPWPPASVGKILDREGESAMAMVENLAGHLSTEPSAQTWLISSWLAPPRPIDRRTLREIARAVDGRLAGEPRFREWLRAEWTTWARQRYRRVRRVLETRRTATSTTTWSRPETPSSDPGAR